MQDFPVAKLHTLKFLVARLHSPRGINVTARPGISAFRFVLSMWCGVALMLISGCSSKPETPPAPTANETAATATPSNVLPPSTADAPSKSPPAKVSPTPAANLPAVQPTKPVDESLRRAAGKLAQKQGSKWTIDEQARAALDAIGPVRVNELVPLLHDADANVRRGAAFYFLSHFDAGNASLVEGYTKLLTDDDRTIRGIALSAFPKFRTAEKLSAAPQLGEILQRFTDDDQHRATAARLLGETGSAAVAQLSVLITAAEGDSSSKTRVASVLACSQIGVPAEVVPVLRKLLADRDTTVRSMALQRLRAMGRDAAPAAEELAKLLDDADEKTRNAAAETLARLGSSSVPAFEARLTSTNATTRELAAYALGKMGPVAVAALPALKKCLGDKDANVKRQVEIAILSIDPRGTQR